MEQMQEEKEVNRKIYEFENAARENNERLRIQLDGTGGDQSMSKRRADSDGESENFNKKSRSVNKGGGNEYDSPYNRKLQEEGYGRDQYGDEVGIIGQKEQRKGKGKDKGNGKTKEKGKESKKVTAQEREHTFLH